MQGSWGEVRGISGSELNKHVLLFTVFIFIFRALVCKSFSFFVVFFILIKIRSWLFSWSNVIMPITY